jgi:hypothetical protein
MTQGFVESTSDLNRMLLFNPPETTLYFKGEDFDKLWMSVTNVWNIMKGEQESHDFVTTYYQCRLGQLYRSKMSNRKTATSDESRSESSDLGKNEPIKKRMKTSCSGVQCFAKLRVSRCKTDNHVEVSTPKSRSNEVYNNHTHSIMDCDIQKIPKLLATVLKDEVAKGYKVSEIKRSLELVVAQSKESQLLKQVEPHIQLYHIHNVKKKSGIGALKESFGSEFEDFYNCVMYLDDEKCLIAVEKEFIVFCDRNRIQTLLDCSYLVLMDSTHGMNQFKWSLFTLHVRNKHGQWCPTVQFFTKNETTDTIAACLQRTKEHIKEKLRHEWEPRYILIDQASAERAAIERSFRGIDAGT